MKSPFLNIAVKASIAFFAVQEAFAADTSNYKGLNTETIIEADIVEGEYGDAAHGAADAYHGAEKSAGLPQMDPTWFPSQIFWLAVTFLCLYIIFSRKILPELSATLESRREQIQSDLDTAQELKEEAEKVHTAYEDIMTEARNKSSDHFVKAEASIKKKSEKKLQEFREKSVEHIQDTEAEINKAKDAAMGDMHAIAAEVASVAAEKIVGISTDLDQAKSLVKNIDKKAA